MALPSSGPISFGEMWSECSSQRNNPPSSIYSQGISGSYGAQFINTANMSDSRLRNLAGFSSTTSTISFSDFYGKNGQPDFNLGISASKTTSFASEYDALAYGMAYLGYSASLGPIGALGNTSWKGETIRTISQLNAGWTLSFRITGNYANNGFSSLTISGSGRTTTLNRSNASHSYDVGEIGSSGSTRWMWLAPHPGAPTQYTYQQQIVPGPYNTAWYGYQNGNITLA